MSFSRKHIGNITKISDMKAMLRICGFKSFDDMINKTNIIQNYSLNSDNIIENVSEKETQENLKNMMKNNISNKSYLGQGYYNTITPAPIKRHIIENPQWYTSYTPYQAEISQGRLESQ